MNKDEPVLKSYTDSTFIATARCKKMDYGYQGEGGQLPEFKIYF
jgi:hypothetical protein